MPLRSATQASPRLWEAGLASQLPPVSFLIESTRTWMPQTADASVGGPVAAG